MSETDAAAGYVNAALTSLSIAQRRLPAEHTQTTELAILVARLQQVHEVLTR